MDSMSYPEHALSLGLLSAALVSQNNDIVCEVIENLRAAGVERTILHEIILQTYLHDGYATALEGVALLQKLWPSAPNRDIESYGMWDQWRERGEVLFRSIYGDVADRVREGVAEASPELSSWMLHEGYGKVLARSGVDIRTRELCTVAVLVIKSRPKQLHSHLRGALRVGVPRELLNSLLDKIESLPDITDRITSARNLLDIVKV